jgi:short-subunit dehydrogenase
MIIYKLIINKIIIFILLCIAIQFLLIVNYFKNFIYKYFLLKEIDLKKKYGENSWVLITGCSSGQGKLLALEFAKRDFNIILSGNIKIKNIEKEINEKYNVKTKCIIVNFSKAYKKKFFKPFEKVLKSIDNNLSILVNNVAHRVAWNPYHEMPDNIINDCIVCGTIVQSRLTKIALKNFNSRNKKYKCAIINITSMCLSSNFWFAEYGEISVPYLSVYEGANAFGYYHSNSIEKEYGENIDILNITPGAVLTENTQFLKDIPFNIDAETYVKNIIKLLGNYNGQQYAYWGHDISSILSNFISSYKKHILYKTGKIISDNYMKLHKKY